MKNLKYKIDDYLNMLPMKSSEALELLATNWGKSADRVRDIKNAKLGSSTNASAEQLLRASLFFSKQLGTEVKVDDLYTEHYKDNVESSGQVAQAA